MISLWLDLRFALRQVARRPAFSALLIAVLAVIYTHSHVDHFGGAAELAALNLSVGPAGGGPVILPEGGLDLEEVERSLVNQALEHLLAGRRGLIRRQGALLLQDEIDLVDGDLFLVHLGRGLARLLFLALVAAAGEYRRQRHDDDRERAG